MNTRPVVQFIVPLLMVLTPAVAAYAGGWAIVTLSDFPDYATAGKPLVLRFAVRQHGMTLLSDLHPAVRARTGTGKAATAPVVAANRRGEYTATLILPEPGEWTISIDSGFNANATTLPPLKVIADGAPAPAAYAPATRGLRLFTAKGCIGCHTHLEVNPEKATQASTLNLTGKRFAPDYLKKFLADPGIKPAEMPNLNLKEEEIDALAAFINKGLQKKEALSR